MHYELRDLYHEEHKKVIIQAARGFAKSTIVGGIFPLHHIIYENRVRNKFVLLVSKTEGHARKLLQTIADILDYSSNFRSLYGYWGRQSAKKWAGREIILKDGSIIMAKGMGQQIVGLKHLNQRPTLVILDDPEDLNNTKTKEAMDNNLTILLKEIVPALDPKIGRVWVIGTPQRQGCMVEKLMDMPGWVSRRYDAIVDEKKRITLWPELHPWDKLMEEKRALESIGKLSIFYSEYRCQIIGDDMQLFKPEYIKYWDGEFERDVHGYAYLNIRAKGEAVEEGFDFGHKLVELPEPVKVPINVFMGIDPASSVSKSADYSVIMVIGVDKEKNIYVLDYFRKRVMPMDLASAVISYYNKYKPDYTNIETVGYQEMLRDYLKRSGEAPYIPGIEAKNNPRTQKSARLESLQIDFALGKVYLKPDMAEFRDELLLYPRAEHDDTLDAYYYAKKRIWIPTHDANYKNELLDEDKYYPDFGGVSADTWLTV